MFLFQLNFKLARFNRWDQFRKPFYPINIHENRIGGNFFVAAENFLLDGDKLEN